MNLPWTLALHQAFKHRLDAKCQKKERKGNKEKKKMMKEDYSNMKKERLAIFLTSDVRKFNLLFTNLFAYTHSVE